MKKIHRVLAMLMAAIMALSLITTAFAEPTIDPAKKTSLSIYKYDITTASAEGAWDTESYVSTGLHDDAVVDKLAKYAIQGVGFTYLRVADVAMSNEMVDGQRKVGVLYGFDNSDRSNAVLSAIGLTAADAHKSENNINYFTSDVLNNNLSVALAANATTIKNALEAAVKNGGVAMTETDATGHTSASEMEQGLYLVVETRVPENVTSTCNPFLISLPMTTVDGSEWNYDVTVYPKNHTGNPDLEKTVREAKNSTGKNTGSLTDIADGYAHTASASIGDTVDYQIISTLPTITSKASSLSEYTYADTLSKGIKYNKNDVVIEFFKDAGCTDKITTWNENSGKFTIVYDDTANTYVVGQKMGGRYLTTPLLMSPDEYDQWSLKRRMGTFFRQKNAENVATKGKNKFDFADMHFDLGPADKIFGPGGVRIKMMGTAELKLGGNIKNIDNPSLPVRNRRTKSIDFDEKINLNVTGKVGDKLNMNLNYNTDATFDFDTKNIKLRYEGKEDEIIKLIEAGNITFPSQNSLIKGASSLFGVRTDMQFGRLKLQTVFSQKKSSTTSVSSKGGVQLTPFEINVADYEENRHFFLHC